MGILDAFGSLASAILAGLVMLGFAILSLFVTVFVVDAAASIAGLSPDDSFVVLGATILAGTAILAGGVGFARPEQDTETGAQ
ncbi:hypothetical protein [Salinibaculum rarum]|jgi:hypothetical protein|uniref:hypothetical protein n=1 Tax=Salinibaculum rarum TaxID=3058903 RepID=UPI00265F10BD|nr:hypothetical protein [Salinibaculum sp. KK48]